MAPKNKISPDIFQRNVLAWYKQYGRKDLPWQQNPAPYRVWISEIMLQQTQVSTVINYFNRFIRRYPDVFALAKSAEDEVMHYWAGLGYYSRARNILKTAKIITDHHQGIFPEDTAVLQTLPGIGRSTAAAIAALAMQKPAAILDGNVKRVLSRVFLLSPWREEARLWEMAELYTPQKKSSVAPYTQAMMDLGAMICTRTRPQCAHCPLTTFCKAHASNLQAEFPDKKPRKIQPVRKTVVLLLRDAKKRAILLEKRPARGIWGGLWSLPEYAPDLPLTLPAIRQFCQQRHGGALGQSIRQKNVLSTFRHTFTHFHLDITPVLLTCQQRFAPPDNTRCWHAPHQPAAIGLPAPIQKLLLDLWA